MRSNSIFSFLKPTTTTRTRDPCDDGVLRPMAYEPGVVEVPHPLAARAPGHGWHMRHMRRLAHRRHGGFDVSRLELSIGMGVKLGAKPFGVGNHHALRFRFCPAACVPITSCAFYVRLYRPIGGSQRLKVLFH